MSQGLLGVPGQSQQSSPAPASVMPRTVFVSPTGSDKAAGAASAPFRTPQKGVLALGRDGGVIQLAGGTYVKARVSVVGTTGLTLRAAPGAKPVLDGRGASAAEGLSAAVEVRDSSQVTIQGLTITGYRTGVEGHAPVGILVTGSGSGVTVAGNHVHHMGHDGQVRGSADINAHGIAAYGTSAKAPLSDLVVRGNEVDHLVLGASEAVVVNGNVDRWSVENNNVHDNNNIGIDAIGFESTIGGAARYTDVNRARNGRIVGNTVSDISADKNPAYLGDGGPCHCADGIYVDGGFNIDVRDNTVTTSDIGIEIAAEDPKGKTHDIDVRGNTVTGSAWVGLSVGGYSPGRGEAFRVRVRENTLIANNGLDDGSPEMLVQYKVSDSSITDNAVSAAGSDPSIIERVERAGTAAQNARLVLHGNRYSSPVAADDARFTWFGREIIGWKAWQTTTGQDTTSTYHHQ